MATNHRSEQHADERRALPLQHEEADHDTDRDRHDVRLERRGADLKPFDRRKNGDGGGQHGIAVEQRGAENAQQQDHALPTRPAPDGRRGQREKRHDAALALIVGSHDQDHVFQRDDDHQRPENRRNSAQDVLRVQGNAVIGVERLLGRIQRARADVAVYDAERRQRQAGDWLLETRIEFGHGTPLARTHASFTNCLAGSRVNPRQRCAPAQECSDDSTHPPKSRKLVPDVVSLAQPAPSARAWQTSDIVDFGPWGVPRSADRQDGQDLLLGRAPQDRSVQQQRGKPRADASHESDPAYNVDGRRQVLETPRQPTTA